MGIVTVILSIKIMKAIFLICLAFVAAQKPNKPNKPSKPNKPQLVSEKLTEFKSLELEAHEVAYLCTAGTDIGNRLTAAWDVCMPMPNMTTTAEGRQKPNKPNNQPNKKCPTVEEVQEWFFKAHEDQLCMFTSIGWLDDAYNFDNVTAEADVLSLPADVAAQLTWEGLGMCMDEFMGEMASDPFAAKCFTKYSEDEIAVLVKMAEATAAMKCFLDKFNMACNGFVKQEIMNFAATLTASG